MRAREAVCIRDLTLLKEIFLCFRHDHVIMGGRPTPVPSLIRFQSPIHVSPYLSTAQPAGMPRSVRLLLTPDVSVLLHSEYDRANNPNLLASDNLTRPLASACSFSSV